MILTLLLSLAAQAQPVVVTGEKPKPERKICKETNATGSRMGGERECHTATEWKEKQASLDARAINELNNTKGFNGGPDGSAGPVIRR